MAERDSEEKKEIPEIAENAENVEEARVIIEAPDSKESIETKKKIDFTKSIDELRTKLSCDFDDWSDLSTDVSEEVVEYGPDMSMDPDFFDNLGKIPNLDELESPRVSEEKVDLEKHRSIIAEGGAFVDPLSGKVIESEESLKVVSKDEDAEVEGDEEEEESEDDGLLLSFLKEDVELAVVAQEEEAIEELFVSQAPKVAVDETDYEELARQEEARQVALITSQLLKGLVNRVVDYCEYIDPDTVLRESLDKRLMADKLVEVMSELQVQKKVLGFLERKCVEHLRRKRQLRYLSTVNVLPAKQEEAKLRDILKNLDRLVCKEKENRELIDSKIVELQEKIAELEVDVRSDIVTFEDVVKKTLFRDGFDKLKAMILNYFSKMQALRNRIAEQRIIFIQRQHKLANLIERAKNLEVIGDGLYLSKFEHLKNEAIALKEKIEDRDEEVAKIRANCYGNLHKVAHLREMEVMLESTVEAQEVALHDLLEESQRCREYLHELKLDHARIRKELKQARLEGGIMDSLDLLYDFDDTKEELNKLQARVQEKRNQFAELQREVQDLEGQYSDLRKLN